MDLIVKKTVSTLKRIFSRFLNTNIKAYITQLAKYTTTLLQAGFTLNYLIMKITTHKIR